MLAIEVTELHKRYGALPVLRGLTLQVQEGEVYGLLGPNGAGKSTLIHLLLGFLRPDGGTLRVLGADPSAAHARVGYLPERVRYHAHFTAGEYLQYMGAFSDLRGPALADRGRTVLGLVGLAGAADRRLGTFSKGMLQRLGIAQALLHDPQLLLVDEPTSGLDPAGQRAMTDLLAELRRKGHSILLCTHQIAETEELCDRVGVLHGSRLAAEARVADLALARGVTILARNGPVPDETARHLVALGPGVEVQAREVHVPDDETLQGHVLRALLDDGVSIAALRPRGGGVEDLYLSTIQSPNAQVSGTAGLAIPPVAGGRTQGGR